MLKYYLDDVRSQRVKVWYACEISSSHDGEYEAQICLLGCIAV
jgi:hypothetical protein